MYPSQNVFSGCRRAKCMPDDAFHDLIGLFFEPSSKKFAGAVIFYRCGKGGNCARMQSCAVCWFSFSSIGPTIFFFFQDASSALFVTAALMIFAEFLASQSPWLSVQRGKRLQ